MNIQRVKSTNKKCRFESDFYTMIICKDKSGNKFGIALTDRELNIGMTRYSKNTEDQIKIKSNKSFFGKILSKLF